MLSPVIHSSVLIPTSPAMPMPSLRGIREIVSASERSVWGQHEHGSTITTGELFQVAKASEWRHKPATGSKSTQEGDS